MPLFAFDQSPGRQFSLGNVLQRALHPGDVAVAVARRLTHGSHPHRAPARCQHLKLQIKRCAITQAVIGHAGGQLAPLRRADHDGRLEICESVFLQSQNEARFI